MTRTKKNHFTQKQNRIAELARALAHPARIAILEVLARHNTCICGDITKELPLAQSTVSQHLKVLKETGIITGEVEGVRTCYCLAPEAPEELKTLFNQLIQNLEQSPKGGCC